MINYASSLTSSYSKRGHHPQIVTRWDSAWALWMLECKTHCCFLPKKFGFLHFWKSSNVTNLGFKKRPRNDQNTEKEKEKERDILLGRRHWGQAKRKNLVFHFRGGRFRDTKAKCSWRWRTKICPWNSEEGHRLNDLLDAIRLSRSTYYYELKKTDKSKILFDYNFIIRTCLVWKNDCKCTITASILFVSGQTPCCIQIPSLKFADDRLCIVHRILRGG